MRERFNPIVSSLPSEWRYFDLFMCLQLKASATDTLGRRSASSTEKNRTAQSLYLLSWGMNTDA